MTKHENGAKRTPALDPSATHLYLELMKRVLTRYGFESEFRPFEYRSDLRGRAVHALNRVLARRRCAIVRQNRFDPNQRALGQDWPPEAETMVGLARLQNLEDCISTIVREDISGDIIETGVWRGGACIFMVAALRAFGDDSRVVWMADSFQGLPQPSGKYEADLDGPQFWRFPELAVGEADVVANFERYGLWDPKRVRILKGWFEDTLPTAPVTELALLRLDGDMYESTLCSLNSLYPRLQPGGFCIVDDYGSVPACQQAVEDYRKSHDVTDEVMWVDKECVYWRRGR